MGNGWVTVAMSEEGNFPRTMLSSRNEAKGVGVHTPPGGGKPGGWPCNAVSPSEIFNQFWEVRMFEHVDDFLVVGKTGEAKLIFDFNSLRKAEFF
jgi:hypothetical protein